MVAAWFYSSLKTGNKIFLYQATYSLCREDFHMWACIQDGYPECPLCWPSSIKLIIFGVDLFAVPVLYGTMLTKPCAYWNHAQNQVNQGHGHDIYVVQLVQSCTERTAFVYMCSGLGAGRITYLVW